MGQVLYKYTKIYSNAEPNFEEGDVFRLTVPIRPAGAVLTSDGKSNEVAKVTEKFTNISDEMRIKPINMIEKCVRNIKIVKVIGDET